MILNFGSDWTKKTVTIENAGSECFWPDLEYKCDVSIDDIFIKKLDIKVFDKNDLMSDSLIGLNSLSLKKLFILGKYGNDIDVPINLFGVKNKLCGKLILKCGFYKKEELKILKITDGFLNGIFHIKKIAGFDIQGGGMFSSSVGELSTYIMIKIPIVRDGIKDKNMIKQMIINKTDKIVSNKKEDKEKEKEDITFWTGKTEVKNGHNPIWDFLDLKSMVSSEILDVGEVTVECWSKILGGLGGDKLIGSGSVSMLPAGQSILYVIQYCM